MDPRLWSGLPQDLLLCIFEYLIYDVRSRRNDDIFWQKWLKVAQGNSLLYRAVLVQQWQAVSVLWSDLLPESSEPLHSIIKGPMMPFRERVYHRLAENYSSGLVHQLLEADHGLYPVQLVRVLDIDLSMPRKENREFGHYSYQSVSRTINAILPEMRLLEMINIYGFPPSTIFEAISRQNNSKLQVLQVGLTTSHGHEYHHHDFPPDIAFDFYDWNQLTGLKSLTKLTAYRFKLDHCQAFRQLILCLPNLRELDLGYAYSRNDISYSPLQLLLGPYEATSDTCGPEFRPSVLTKLSTGFRRLQFNDSRHNGPNQLQAPLSSQIHNISLSRCRMEELIIRICNLYTVRNLLQWLKRDTLKLLVFSPLLPESSENCYDLPAIMELTNTIVAAHQESLQEIIFDNVSTTHPNFARAFNKRWGGQFTISDIVITMDVPPDGLVPDLDSGQDDYNAHVTHYSHYLGEPTLPESFFGSPKDTNRWGSSLRRVRIMPTNCPYQKGIDINDLLEESNTQQLRILIINSCRWYHRCTRVIGHNQWVADSFLCNAPATLRYIQICNDTYWVHHTEGNVAIAQLFDPSNTNLADHNGSIIREYRSWQTPDDMKFIHGHSGLHYNEHDRYEKVYPARPYENWLPSYDFLVARRQCA